MSKLKKLLILDIQQTFFMKMMCIIWYTSQKDLIMKHKEK